MRRFTGASQGTDANNPNARRHTAAAPAVSMLLQARPPYAELKDAPTAAILDALRQLREADGQHKKITAFVRFLQDVRGEERSGFLYETLVKANGCTTGSADHVRELLREMRNGNREGLSSATYHAALRVCKAENTHSLEALGAGCDILF